MTAFVLDASIALSWCFRDEAAPSTWQLLEMLEEDSAVVPTIWSLEISNILVEAERKNRLTESKSAEFLHLLEQLKIETDSETSLRAFGEILMLARKYQLSTYDSAYLNTAMRFGVPLATKDKQLAKVARSLGIEILPK